MNGVTHPDGPPSIFVMLGRKIVVVGTPGVPHGAAGTVDAPSFSGDASAETAGRGALASVSMSTQTSNATTFLTAGSMR
jgi:hypothetical protein